jgi:DNA-binding transcriptional regulator YhcF (GntR family)
MRYLHKHRGRIILCLDVSHYKKVPMMNTKKGVLIMSENRLSVLTSAEQLVHEYIKDLAEVSGGSIVKSTRDIAKEMSDTYADRLEQSVRKKRVVNGEGSHVVDGEEDTENLLISTATISRAVKKLREEGIVSVRASNSKDKPNEIIYLGMPNAEEQVEDILNMAKNLSLSLNRFEKILAKKDKQIRDYQAKCNTLYHDVDELREKLLQANTLNKNLLETVQSLQKNQDPFNGGKLISVTDLGDGTTAYLVQH